MEITTQTTIEQFLKHILPHAYRSGLHRVPAKFATDMFLLLHSMTTVLISDLLIDYLDKQNNTIAKQLTQFKEEIWLTAFFHDILKEANIRGERIDHQDIQPDDIRVWLERLDIRLKVTTPMRLAARIAIHERSGLPLFSAFANVEEDDLPQLVIRLSDQLASMSGINEHWYYEGHGLPSLADTFNGRGRLKGINQRLQAWGVSEPLHLFSHYHTQLTYPYLTNQLLAGTVASIRSLGPEPLLVLANGVIYIGTQSQYESVQHHASDSTEDGLTTSILKHTWDRIAKAIDESPLRPEDIKSTKNGMKIFSQLRLVGTPLKGERDILTTIGLCLSTSISPKTFGKKSVKDKAVEVDKHIHNMLELLKKLPRLYEDTVQSPQIPELRIGEEKLQFKDIPIQSNFSLDTLKTKINGLADLTAINLEFRRFGDDLASYVQSANTYEFEVGLHQRMQSLFESAVCAIADGGIVVAGIPLQFPSKGKKLVEKFCPACGRQAFKSKNAQRATIQQRETFFPVKVRLHTNNGAGAGSDGTRSVCQACWLELALRGMSFRAEAFSPEKNKNGLLHLHLLPFFAFPMNWMEAAQQQFGFRRGDLRTQFSEATLKMLYEALFSENEAHGDWEWISRVANPMRMMGEAFFAPSDEANNRDEFFGTPSLDVAGSVTLSVYARRNERKPGGKDLEDEIGRKEMWTRGVMLAGLLAEALPVRVVVSESPLINFDHAAITSSLTFVNPPELITNVIARVREHQSKQSKRFRYKGGENDVSRAELRDLLKVFIFALRVNKTLGGSIITKNGREQNRLDRKSRRSVEIIQALGDEALVGAWLHQRDCQSRKYRPEWFNADYRIFTQACLEVDKMLNPERVDRLRNLARITQTFYAPPVYDSSHALTLPFKVATKTLQKFIGTEVTEDELKTIMRSDIESAVRRQADVEGSRAWIVLKRAKNRRQPNESPVAVQLTGGVQAFVDAFVDDIVYGICRDTTNFLLLRKRMQSGYLIQMKDLALATWEREGWRMFKSVVMDNKASKTDDEFSIPA